MTSEEVCFLPATRLARLIAARELSPVDAVEAVLDRAQQLNPSLNAFAHLAADQARAAARQAQAAVMAGDRLGPLHGVPITVKDNVAVAGLPLGHGSIAIEPVIPDRDAIAVARARAAGAVIIGKTTLPEFAHKVLTVNNAQGVTHNPWNLAHSPGGSSGGGGAALAAGIAPLAIATDGGGSIRCPASWNGVVGLKPTLGRIPGEAMPDGFGNFAYIGPMARHTDDLALLLSVMEGPSPADPFALRPPPADAPVTVQGMRIGWLPHVGEHRTDAVTAAITERAVGALANAGAEVETLSAPCFEGLYAVYAVLASTARAARYGHILDTAGDRMTPTLRDCIVQGRGWSAVQWLAAHDRRTALFRAVQALFERFDILATPTTTTTAPRLDSIDPGYPGGYPAWAVALHPFNLSGHPALSTPAGFTDDGLPVGLQLVGPWFGERRLLVASAALEAMLGLAEHRPPVAPVPAHI